MNSETESGRLVNFQVQYCPYKVVEIFEQAKAVYGLSRKELILIAAKNLDKNVRKELKIKKQNS